MAKDDDVKNTLAEIMAEVEAEKKRLTKQEVMAMFQDAISEIKIGMSNLNPELINYIMANAGTSAGQGSTGNEPTKKAPVQTVTTKIPQPSGSKGKKCYTPPTFGTHLNQILADLLGGNNVYLYGRAGTGKTYLASNIAKSILSREEYTINCSQWTSPIDIIGGETIRGYSQGRLVEAWQNGGMLILDELPKLDPNTAGLLNEALAKTGDTPRECVLEFEGTLKLGDTVKIGQQSDKTEVFTRDLNKIKYFYVVRKGVLKTIILSNGKTFADLDDEKTSTRPLPEKFTNEDTVYLMPTIVDGKGSRIPKHPDFCVIATGNTDMKSPTKNYSGNNVQDYSLVDRFVGSYYNVTENIDEERRNTHRPAFLVCLMLRNWIVSKGEDMVESISFRTMLNFSRSYQAQKMHEMGAYFDTMQGRKTSKTLRDSVVSFVNTLPPKARTDFGNETQVNQIMDNPTRFMTDSVFLFDFWTMTGFDAMDGVADKSFAQVLENSGIKMETFNKELNDIDTEIAKHLPKKV